MAMAENPDYRPSGVFWRKSACYNGWNSLRAAFTSSAEENALLLNSGLFRLLHELKQNFSAPAETNDPSKSDEIRRERMMSAYIKFNYKYINRGDALRIQVKPATHSATAPRPR
jgi:hypothetical protein